jgi:hypothetical protein
MNSDIATQLIALRDRDLAKRSELAERGELHEGYHPEMEAVHAENARAFEGILDTDGWPRVSEVGMEAATAAWMLATHAIGQPDFQRRCLAALEEAVEDDEAPAAHAAMLLDRICFNERRPQLYGTLLDWDENDELSPWPIEDAGGVEERRREIGLPPLDESIARSRAQAEVEGGRAPKSHAERQAEIDAWARRTGWLED